MFLFGKKRKERKQFEYFSKCAEMGIPEAMYNLFMCYHKGIGVERNDACAMEWLIKAAEAGNDGAEDMLFFLTNPSYDHYPEKVKAQLDQYFAKKEAEKQALLEKLMQET